MIVRNHPELKREVKFHDGTHQLMKIGIQLLPVNPDPHGNTHTLTVPCPAKKRIPHLSYTVANLKLDEQTDYSLLPVNPKLTETK